MTSFIRAFANSAAASSSSSSMVSGYIANFHQPPLQIGLTGSIGMGKSTVTGHFRRMGFKVFDADAAVHELYGEGGEAVPEIKKLFPEAIESNRVNRAKLAERVLGFPEALKAIESIVHPLVASKRNLFFRESVESNELLIVYDIPLLFENRAMYELDYVLVATASAETQRMRVMKRPGMTAEKFDSILKKQVPDAEKREKADYVVDTDHDSFVPAKAQLANIIEAIINRHQSHFEAWKKKDASSGFSLQYQSTVKGQELGSVDVSALMPLNRYFDYVIFDLDETLAPVQPALAQAMDALNSFMDENMPKSSTAVRERLRETMGRLSTETPLISHDLTEIRRLALRSIASEYGEEALVDDAMKVFIGARSNLDPILYADSIPCLNWLQSQGIRSAILTNGNADIPRDTNLGNRIEFTLCAADVGAMKPSLVPFISAVQATSGSVPKRILFVGDSVRHDVAGAKAAGMHCALIVRSDSTISNRSSAGECSAVADGSVDSHLTPDIVFSSLEPEELCVKIFDYVKKFNVP